MRHYIRSYERLAAPPQTKLDFRVGSQPEVSDGHENVGFRGQSGNRFRAAACLLVAKRRERQDKRIEFRIGVNLGDVIVEGDDIYGDGVNIAARLERLAEPGGICVSRTVFDHVKGKAELAFEDLGDREVKNVAEPVHVYRIVLYGQSQDPDIVGSRRNAFRRRWVVGVGIVMFLAVGGLIAWTAFEPDQSSSSKTGCTDHLGLPVPAEECSKIQE